MSTFGGSLLPEDPKATIAVRLGAPVRGKFRENHMRPPFRSKQEVIIKAPLETVWEFNMDITKIPAFHPRVIKVDLLSGKSLREPGVSYRCHLSGGKHTCVEKDIEIVPMQKLVTVLPEDTFGISKVLPDYVVETTLHRVGRSSTKIEISHYYSTPTLKTKNCPRHSRHPKWYEGCNRREGRNDQEWLTKPTFL